MKTIDYDKLLNQICKLKQDKRFKNNKNTTAALEEIIYWAEEETIPTIKEKIL